jgi:hypothetical protein
MGELDMTKRIIEHKHTLDIKLTIILAVIAIGICANAFIPAFTIKDALADWIDGSMSITVSGGLSVY